MSRSNTGSMMDVFGPYVTDAQFQLVLVALIAEDAYLAHRTIEHTLHREQRRLVLVDQVDLAELSEQVLDGAAQLLDLILALIDRIAPLQLEGKRASVLAQPGHPGQLAYEQQHPLDRAVDRVQIVERVDPLDGHGNGQQPVAAIRQRLAASFHRFCFIFSCSPGEPVPSFGFASVLLAVAGFSSVRFCRLLTGALAFGTGPVSRTFAKCSFSFSFTSTVPSAVRVGSDGSDGMIITGIDAMSMGGAGFGSMSTTGAGVLRFTGVFFGAWLMAVEEVEGKELVVMLVVVVVAVACSCCCLPRGDALLALAFILGCLDAMVTFSLAPTLAAPSSREDRSIPLGNMCGVCKVSPSTARRKGAVVRGISGKVGGDLSSVREETLLAPDSTARRNVSSNGFTFCRSSNSPTSSHLPINRVGVGVWSANSPPPAPFWGICRFRLRSCFFVCTLQYPSEG
uniref:Uncharacterized protein n=1 Tax=Anopheles coluzzii TaxID=1518534 RepID=A0A8W7PDF1_ANOCL